MPVDFPAFVLQPSEVLMKASMKKALFIWYTAVHVRVREELQDVFIYIFLAKYCSVLLLCVLEAN